MLAERSAEPGVSRQPWPRRGQFLGDYAGMAAVLAALVGFFALKTQYFLTRDTFLAIANQVPAAVVIAVGITFVLIIAEIDPVFRIWPARLQRVMVHNIGTIGRNRFTRHPPRLVLTCHHASARRQSVRA